MEARLRASAKLISIILLSITFSIASIGQDSKSQNAAGPAVKSVEGSKTFVSAEGRFSIALPEIKGDPLALNLGIGRYIGKGFSWLQSQGSYTIVYADKPADVRPRSDPKILALMRTPILWQIQLDKGKSAREMPMRMGYLLGREYRWETQDVITVIRTFVSGDRVYEITANVPLEDGKETSAALKVLGTFKILTDGDMKKLVRQ
jgi:hypothetical protein